MSITESGMRSLASEMTSTFRLTDVKLEQLPTAPGKAAMVSVTGHQQVGDKLVAFNKIVAADQVDPLTGKAAWDIRADTPGMPPPNRNIPLTVADLRALMTSGVLKPVAHFALTLSDILLMLSKILSKQKFEEIKTGAKLSELGMAMAKLGAEMGVDAAKLKVKEAMLKVVGAAVSMGTAVAMTTMTLKGALGAQKQRANFQQQSKKDTGLTAAQDKWKANPNNAGKPLPGAMGKPERKRAEARMEQLEKKQKDHEAFKAGTDRVSGTPAGAAPAAPPLRPAEKKELLDLKDRTAIDTSQVNYNKANKTFERELGQKLEVTNQITNSMRLFSQGMSGIFDSMGTIMYAVDIAKLEGGQKILEAARQGFLANLIQSFSSDIRDAEETLKKIQDLAASYLSLETERTKK